MSCEEIEFSIAAEVTERAKMAAGAGYDDAYEAGLRLAGDLRTKSQLRAEHMPAVRRPRQPERERGTGKP
jgi:hypothetical protein